MKQQDPLQQYHALRSLLSNERDAIQTRLQEINAALGGGEAPVPVAGVGEVLKKPDRPPGKAKRAANTMSLRETVLKVLTSTPVTRQDLLGAVQKAGYRFASADPLNSLQTFLYGTGKKLVKNVDGKFARAGTAASPSTKPAPESKAVAKAPAAKPAKKKSKMSAAGLANIRAAQKARWAKINATKAKK